MEVIRICASNPNAITAHFNLYDSQSPPSPSIWNIFPFLLYALLLTRHLLLPPPPLLLHLQLNNPLVKV